MWRDLTTTALVRRAAVLGLRFLMIWALVCFFAIALAVSCWATLLVRTPI